VLEAFGTGRFSLTFPPDLVVRVRRPELPGSLDFFGVNYYSRVHMRCPGRLRRPADFAYVDRSGRGMTDNGWEIAPESLQALLKEASSLGLPLAVTENGIDLVFCAGPMMEALWQALPSERRGGYAKDSATLESSVVAAVRDGDAIMVKGSAGSKMAPIVKTLATRYGREAERPAARAES